MGFRGTAAALFALFLLAAPLSAAFEMHSLQVTISVNPDGSAHAQEVISFVINSTESRDLYESTFKYNQLSDYAERIGLSDIRHHVSRAQADISGLRIRPQPVERCNELLGICQASLIFDYDVNASANATGLFLTDNYKPRTTKFSLNPNALSFDTTTAGDIILNKGTTLTIVLPKDATKIYFSKEPDNIASEANAQYEIDGNINYYVGPERKFSWSGETLPQFELSYEREDSLEGEIMQFFKKGQESLTAVVFSSQGIASFLIAAVLLASVLYINRLKK